MMEEGIGKAYVEIPKFNGANVPVTVAARVMRKDPQFVRLCIERGLLDIGVAVKMEGSSRYDYYISPFKLWRETGYVYDGEAR